MSDFDAGIESVSTVETNKELLEQGENEMGELKKQLAPLSEEEAQAVHEAFAAGKDGPAPAAANEDDSLLTGCALLTEVESQVNNDVNETDGFDVTFMSGECFRLSDTQRMAFTFDASKLKAANDVENIGGTFTTFESSLLETIVKENSLSVRVKEEGGKTHYLFEKQANRPIILVTVFDVAGRKMVKMTNIILPLSQLLTLEKCVSVDKPIQKEGKTNLFEQGKVKCTFEDGETIRIDDIDVSFMMEIISHLSSVYEDDAETEYESDKAAAPVVQRVVYHQPFFTEPIKERLISFVAGAVISGFGIWFGHGMV